MHPRISPSTVLAVAHALREAAATCGAIYLADAASVLKDVAPFVGRLGLSAAIITHGFPEGDAPAPPLPAVPDGAPAEALALAALALMGAFDALRIASGHRGCLGNAAGDFLNEASEAVLHVATRAFWRAEDQGIRLDDIAQRLSVRGIGCRTDWPA